MRNLHNTENLWDEVTEILRDQFIVFNNFDIKINKEEIKNKVFNLIM